MEPRLGHPAIDDDDDVPHRAGPAPRRGAIWGVVLAVILMAGAAVYYYWQRPPDIAPAPAPPAEVPPPPAAASAEPAVHHPIEADVARPLPALGDSDAALREALAGVIGEQPLAKFFYPDGMIRRIVATIDSLARRKAPLRVMPVKPVAGAFVIAGTGGDRVISPDNSRRYAPYVSIAQAVDARKLVAVYVRLYPLFQRAYEDVGFPNGYFNDRLVEVLDDLLDAPDVTGPVKLIRPKVFYLFADPALEARSAGQKIMIRMGNENAAKVKAKLREIRQEVTRGAPGRDPH